MKKTLGMCILIICIGAFGANIIPTSPDLLTFKAAALVNNTLNAQPGLKLVFQDEFSTKTLNTSKWMNQLQWGRTNSPELQYYATNAFSFSNGILHINAQKKSSNGKSYTSGALITYKSFKFTYGVVQIRARTPAGKGLWPALWLLDYTGGAEEIDILESLGHQPNVAYMTLHYPTSNGSENTGTYFNGPDLSAGFHVFSVDWSPSAVVWSIDGVERYRLTEHVPSKPMYLIMNLAVGGDWPGSPDQYTKFPASFDIDYVRVYKNQ